VTTTTVAPPVEHTAELTEGPVLQVSGLRRSFAGVAALDGVDLVVNPHEIVALLGASGCGKTTLLRGIAGLTELDGGEITLRGRSIVELAPGSRDIAMVFQEGALFPHLTVERNIAVGLRPGDDRARIQPIARLLHIEGLLGRQPHELSGGQRQRVGIARALARRPALMLMDEPFAALDADLRLELRRELRRLHQIGELAETVFVTHDQTEALGIADRIAIMSAGRILQQGTPVELLERPATLAVATFLGVPKISVLRAVSGFVLAVRPTDIDAGDAAARAELTTTVRVTASEPFAGGWLVSAQSGSGVDLEVVAEWTTKPVVGDELTVGTRVAHLHAFDAVSGERIALPEQILRERWAEVMQP
jgi:ABC-type sugar transport system ATPase subunit